MAIGSVGLILETSCSLTGCTSGTQAPDPGSEFVNISLLFYSWALTVPLFAFFILPVQVMDASNVRLAIKEKNIVTNPTVPYRVIIKGFGAILVIYGLVTGIGSGEGSAIETLFTIFFIFLPIIPILILYGLVSESKLSNNFRSYLKGLNIEEKEIKITKVP